MREDLLKQISDYVRPYQTEGKGIKELSKASTDGNKAVQDTDNVAIAATSYLREININSDGYSKDGKSLADRLPASREEESARRNGFIMSVMNTTGKDISELQDKGLSAEDMDPGDFVTVSDKIKVNLAKAGADITMMGGLDADTIENVTGNSDIAMSIERSLSSNDLPVTEDIINDAKEADYKYQEITDRLSGEEKAFLPEKTVSYLIKNNAEPSIKNIYQGLFLGQGKESLSITAAIEMTTVNQELKISFGKVIEEAGLSVNELTEKMAAWLLAEKLPVTADNIAFLNKLIKNPMEGKNDISDLMTNAVSEGKNPQDALLVSGFSMAEKADAAISVINNTDEKAAANALQSGKILNIRTLSYLSVEIMAVETSATSIRQTSVSMSMEISGASTNDISNLIKEAKNLMTRESLVTLQKLGINIELEPLNDMVEELKALDPVNSLDQDQTALYNTVLSEAEEIADMPVGLLGRFGMAFSSMTFSALYTEGKTYSESFISARASYEKISDNIKFDKMTETYEAVGTEVRKDLGDSIKKAFGNIDDILDDLDLDKNDDNRRAVRILGYNSLEITTENIATVKTADMTVQRALNRLNPRTVLNMIKDGINPLDMTMSELSDSASHEGGDKGRDDERNFAEFLWKAEHNKEITESEKETYIGIYRLIHQINKSDGAVIGQLLHQNAEITMRNMMTAVRSRKAEGADFSIDDNFGLTVEFNRSELSITEQIELSFHSMHLKNAEDKLTPAALHSMGTEAVMDASPEELDNSLDRLANEEAVKEEEKAWQENRLSDIKESVLQDEKVYSLLEKMDIPASPVNLTAAYNMINNGRRVFSQLAKRHVNENGTVVDIDDPDISAMLQQVMERYGEACKTPEDMAEAQERLADLAENAMKNFMERGHGDYVDIKALQSMKQELGLYRRMSEDQIYHIPVLVADQNGVMTLKVVNGQKKHGLVDIFLNLGQRAMVRASFRAEGESIRGRIDASDRSEEQFFEARLQELSASIERQSGLEAKISIRRTDVSFPYDMYEKEPVNEETDRVSTEKLYSVARAFIESLNN